MSGNLLTLNGKTVTEQDTDPLTEEVSEPVIDPEEMISPKTAGRLYGCGKNNIVNHIQGRSKPILKAIRGNSNEWLIKRKDFDAWLIEKRKKASAAPISEHVSKAPVTMSVPVSVPPLQEGEGVYRATITGLEARLEDAKAAISDLRGRLDAQGTAHQEAMEVKEAQHRADMAAQADRHRADMIAKDGRIEELLGRERTILEEQVASARQVGVLEGQVGILRAQIEDAQNRAKEAKLALERAEASENAPRASGGRLARVWDALWKH